MHPCRNWSTARWLRRWLEGERQMSKRSPPLSQRGLDLSDPLAGFDGRGAGHGANNGLMRGQFAMGFGVHGRHALGVGVSLPDSMRLDAAIEANLRGLGYGR